MLRNGSPQTSVYAGPLPQQKSTLRSYNVMSKSTRRTKQRKKMSKVTERIWRNNQALAVSKKHRLISRPTKSPAAISQPLA